MEWRGLKFDYKRHRFFYFIVFLCSKLPTSIIFNTKCYPRENVIMFLECQWRGKKKGKDFFFLIRSSLFRYSGLYFCMCVDPDDNELEILDIIHHYVEILDLYIW